MIIQVNPKFYRPAEVDLLVGDASKAKKVLGWQPMISIYKLVEEMCKEDRI